MSSQTQEVSQDSKRLFVGNIEFNVTTDQLKTFFGQFGEVTDARIITNRFTNRPRGYGFVEFSSEDSVRAMLQTNVPLQLNNRELRVAMSKRKDRPLRKSVFVGNLPATVTTDQLKSHFSQFGEVKSGYVVTDRKTNTSRGYGAVIFANGTDGEKVLQMRDMKMGDSTLTIRHYRARRRFQGGRRPFERGSEGFRTREAERGPSVFDGRRFESSVSRSQTNPNDTQRVSTYDKGYHAGYQRALTERK